MTQIDVSFFYNKIGDNMKVYLDLILIINFIFDFLILLSVSYILKRNTSITRLLLGAFSGSVSILFLFIKLNNLTLILFKLIISIIMLIVTFNYKNFKYFMHNFIYLYLVSIILGGFLYFINNSFCYNNKGFIFYKNGNVVSILFLIILSPLILYLYYKELKNYKINYSNYYNIELFFNEKDKIKLIAFLDTGNKLIDPYKKRNIIIVDRKKIIYDINEFKMILVPFKTINYNGVLKCFKVNKMIIEGIGNRYNFLVGIMDESFHMDGIDCIIGSRILEG